MDPLFVNDVVDELKSLSKFSSPQKVVLKTAFPVTPFVC